MEDSKKQLKGSPSRDAFKHWHKTLSSHLYGTDFDFVLVRKYPQPGIVAIIDFKKLNEGDEISFSECIAYNDAIKHWPMFIVYSQEPFDKFSIWEYLGGNPYPNPPEINLKHACNLTNAKEYEKWEMSIRLKNNKT